MSAVPAPGGPSPAARAATRRHVGLLLREGLEFLLDGERRTVVRGGVQSLDGVPALGLRRPDGSVEHVPVQELIFTRQVSLPPATDTPPAPPAARVGLEDLTAAQVRRLQVRLAHALEAETGYRSGDPAVAIEGEPFPQYDPALVPSVVQRRKNKAEELERAARALGDPGAGSDTADLSPRTLQRLALSWQEHESLAALIDGRHVRPRVGRQVKENVRRAIHEVEEDFKGKSRVSKQTKHRRLEYLLASYGVPQDEWPSYKTYTRCVRDWFGSDGARMKYRRTDAALPDPGQPVTPTRPGEVVFLDTNSWDVLVRVNRLVLLGQWVK